jgi:hypothetical protein
MQKVVKFLESNVEWICLAIAVLYLGWAAWTYLLNDPTAKQLEGHTVGVGSVDKFIDENAAQRLREKMNPDVEPPKFEVKPFNEAFLAAINMDNVAPTQLADADFDYSPFDSATMPGINPAKGGNPVQQLPTLPAAHPLLALAGLNTLAPAQNNGGAPAGPAAPGAAPAPGKDVRMVIAAFTIPWTDLYDQWNKSFGPIAPGGQPRLSPANFQLVELTAYRSEKIGDKWVDDKDPIQIINGADLPPYPKAGDKQAEVAYQEALQKSPKSIPYPDIPTATAGATWKDPVQYLPGANPQPSTPAGGDQGTSMVPQTTPRFVNAAYQLRDKVDVQYGPRGGGGYGGGGPPPMWRPPAPPTAPPAAPTAPETPPPAPVVPPEDGTVTPVTALANPNPPAGQVAPTPPQAQMNVVAMPAKSPDLCVYIIDTSAAAGKTYRYRIVYKALNPLFNKAANHVAQKNAAWLAQFDLESPMSDWSPDITLPKQTFFFCGQPKGRVGNTGSGEVAFPFDVFTWSNGKWQKETFNASRGDPIGGTVGPIDYSTGYTFVDQGKKRNKTMITIVDRDGNPEIRDAAADLGSADYKKVTQWLTLPVNVPGQAAPSMPGMPGGMPGGAPYGGAPYGPGPGGPGGPYGPGPTPPPG